MMRPYTAAERAYVQARLADAIAPAPRPNLFGRARSRAAAVEPIERSELYQMLMDRGVPGALATDATVRARQASARDRRGFYRALADAEFDLTTAEELAIEAADRGLRPNHHLTAIDDRRRFAERIRMLLRQGEADLVDAASRSRGLSPATQAAMLYDAAERVALDFKYILMEMGEVVPKALRTPPAGAGTKARLNYVERVVGVGRQISERIS